MERTRPDANPMVPMANALFQYTRTMRTYTGTFVRGSSWKIGRSLFSLRNDSSTDRPHSGTKMSGIKKTRTAWGTRYSSANSSGAQNVPVKMKKLLRSVLSAEK